MNLTIRQKELLEKFKKQPHYKRNGAVYLSKKIGFSVEDIHIVRAYMKTEKSNSIKNTHKNNVPFVNEIKGTENGDQLQTIKSETPLSPEEISKLAQVDGITSYVTNYWLKSQVNGIYTYSVQVKKSINDFYSLEDLEAKLKELIPTITPVKLSKIKSSSKFYDNLIIYISDIHAGAKNSELNIHNITYSEQDLQERLNKIIERLIFLGNTYENIIVVNLGDSVDGWDGFTTRKGHSLGSMSNRDQFDIYFRCMTNFYTSLFESKLANNYLVWNCLDDNHGGLQFSYICNKSVENYLSLKYPEVEFYQQDKFIDVLTLGNHLFAFTHGKDGDIMKYPMKKVLDDKLDSWAQQYFNELGYHNKWNHLIKGDLHLFAMEKGKFGDYINIPSIYGTSDYISLNFGISRPGAVIQELNYDIEETRITPIWL